MCRELLILLLVPSHALADCTITQVGVEFDLPDSALSLAIEGSYAYVTCGLDPLHIFDISDLSAPSLVGTYPGYGVPLQVRDGIAYIGAGNVVYCLDVSDPSSPLLLGQVNLPFGAGATYLVLQGAYAYVTTSSAYFIVINIQDPGNPAVVGWSAANNGLNGVAVQGDRAYTAELDSGLSVVDISTPSNPQILGRESTDLTGYGVDVRDHLVCIVDERFDGFRTIDVSDPTQPLTLGGLPDETGGPESLVMVGNAAYLMSSPNLLAIDLTNPSQPTIAASYFIFFGASILDIHDDLAVVIGTLPRRLMFFDISDCNRAINCPADIDGDGVVTPFDSNACMARFGCAVGDSDPICNRCDLDGDGVVNPFDSNAVMAAFGDCP